MILLLLGLRAAVGEVTLGDEVESDLLLVLSMMPPRLIPMLLVAATAAAAAVVMMGLAEDGGP